MSHIDFIPRRVFIFQSCCEGFILLRLKLINKSCRHLVLDLLMDLMMAFFNESYKFSDIYSSKSTTSVEMSWGSCHTTYTYLVCYDMICLALKIARSWKNQVCTFVVLYAGRFKVNVASVWSVFNSVAIVFWYCYRFRNILMSRWCLAMLKIMCVNASDGWFSLL